jgi:SPP1 gp7 family putative phage head morphogenesis protein
MPRRLVSPDGKRKVLGAVHPNAGLCAEYRRKLEREIAAMHTSIMHWLTATYRANPPVMAADALPAEGIRRTLRELRTRWEDRFEEIAPKLARYFSVAAGARSDASLKSLLAKGGMTVKFTPSRAVNDVLAANIAENVSLIRSIPERHLTQIEGMVMRSVQTGRDLASLTRDLQSTFGVTKKRAAFIARDQNNKATATITRVRQQELGVTKAIWLHSGGGRHPRPTHVAKSGKEYDITTGWYDPAEQEWLWPGTAINCRCVSKVVLPGM